MGNPGYHPQLKEQIRPAFQRLLQLVNRLLVQQEDSANELSLYALKVMCLDKGKVNK